MHFEQHLSIRKISSLTNLARQTVRKALADAEIPKYQLTKPRPSPVMGPYREVIVGWLEAEKLPGYPKKQRLTAKRIYELLRDDYGFTGGESTVRQYVASLRDEPKECFLVLSAGAGEQIQVDFGEAEVIIGGVRQKAYLFCMRFKYSLVPFVVAFRTERIEAFLEGHVRAFQYFGGIPKEGLYDNAKTQVVKILAGPYRIEHDQFSSLRAHYLFRSQFCRPDHGNEKGSAEGLVKDVRRSALSPLPSFAAWEDLNQHLLQWCVKIRERHWEKWLEEKAALSPLPLKPFCSARIVQPKVNTYSLVTVDRSRYSVPARYIGRRLLARVYTDRLELIDKDMIVAAHSRSYNGGSLNLDIHHFLPVLEHKPHAVTNARVVRDLPEPFQTLREHLSQLRPDGYKDFLPVLLLLREYTAEEVTEAIESVGIAYATVDTLRTVLTNGRFTTRLELPEQITIADVQQYDRLLGVVAGC